MNLLLTVLLDLEKPLVKDGDADDVDVHLYRSMIGSLMYLTASRPDIIYLKGKPTLGLWYSRDSPFELVAYTDSDYAGATQDRKSTTGGCQFLGNRLISKQCKKQIMVATSTTKVEYVAAASCCGQVLWIQNQLLDYRYNFMNTMIHIDNNNTLCIIENPVQHSKTKHIEIRHHFIRDCNAKKLIQMVKIDTEHNVADLLTKGFDAGRFQYMVSILFEGRLLMSICSQAWMKGHVGDEAVHKELGDRMERAATIASSLEAEQDSDAQTRFKTTSKLSNDPPLSRVNTLRSGEDIMKVIELMAHCTTLSELSSCIRIGALKVFLLSNVTVMNDNTLHVDAGLSCSSYVVHEDDLKSMAIGSTMLDTRIKFKYLEQLLVFIDQQQIAALSTNEDGVRGITATIDRKLLLSFAWKLTVQPPSTPPSSQTIPVTEEAAPIPHESPLQSVYSLGHDEGSLSLNELTDLCTSLSKKVESLESELKKTKQTYNAALTKLIKKVKMLEQTIKTSQARRRAKVVISDDEKAEEDPSNQGRSLIEELDLDAGIYLVPPHALDQRSAATTLVDAARRRQSVENVQTYTRRRKVSTGSGGVSTASRLVSTADISTASELDSTASVKAKDKGKAIMHESEPPNKIKKRVQVQMSVDVELAKKVFEEEQARYNAEQEARLKAKQEQERIDFETTLELKKQLDEREEVAAKVDQAHDIDWSDPAVLRYHTLQNRPFSVAEVRKNMCLYMKNQDGYKMSHFKGMSYKDIRPIFKRVWDQNQAFIPTGSEIEKEVMKRSRFDLQQESSKPVEEEIKLEDDTKKEELQVFLNIVPEEESLDVESLATKQDVLELYRLVKERFQIASLKGYDLLLWGDLKTLIEPNEEDEIWRNQQDWNLKN
ncbi:hypothetical protein Tco_0492366 [Tanacetum coccineum]